MREFFNPITTLIITIIFSMISWIAKPWLQQWIQQWQKNRAMQEEANKLKKLFYSKRDSIKLIIFNNSDLMRMLRTITAPHELPTKSEKLFSTTEIESFITNKSFETIEPELFEIIKNLNNKFIMANEKFDKFRELIEKNNDDLNSKNVKSSIIKELETLQVEIEEFYRKEILNLS